MRATLKDPAHIRYSKRSLAKGTKVELEHTRSKRAARVIAKHHLAEHPRYYEEHEKMEERLGLYPNEDSFGTVYGALCVASTAASAYHGYKRNNSVGWAVVWGACGALFPIVTPAIAFAQGFGKPA